MGSGLRFPGHSQDLAVLAQKERWRLLNQKVPGDLPSTPLGIHWCTGHQLPTQVLLIAAGPLALPPGRALCFWSCFIFSPIPSITKNQSPTSPISSPALHLPNLVGQSRVQRRRSPTLGTKWPRDRQEQAWQPTHPQSWRAQEDCNPDPGRKHSGQGTERAWGRQLMGGKLT